MVVIFEKNYNEILKVVIQLVSTFGLKESYLIKSYLTFCFKYQLFTKYTIYNSAKIYDLITFLSLLKIFNIIKQILRKNTNKLLICNKL